MFFKEPLLLKEILEILGITPDSPLSSSHLETMLQSLETPEKAGPGSLIFLKKGYSPSKIRHLKCAFALVEGPANGYSLPCQQVEDVYPLLASLLHSQAQNLVPWISDYTGPFKPYSEMIQGDVSVETELGPGCYVGKGSLVLPGCTIEPGAIIRENCLLESGVTVQSGAVIGVHGFGFYDSEAFKQPIPHLAGVVIGRNSFIGAGTVIAAGVLHSTRLGEYCKIDSHVQIAHNVELGPFSIMASQSGIAGSTTVGSHLLMGGASSIAGHLTLGNHVTIAARSGVTKSQPDHALLGGFPAQKLSDWKRQQIALRKIK